MRLPLSGAAFADSVPVRLSGVPSIDVNRPGLVVQPVPDSLGTELGRWQPIGSDSALVSLTSVGAAIPRRVACGDR
jgi:hypothetical protein